MIREIVRQKMVDAMKVKDKKTKDVYAYLLDQIQKAEKGMQSDKNPNPVLSEADEITVVQKLVKQTRDSIDKTVAEASKKNLNMEDLKDFIADREFELAIYTQFMPQEMTADEIKSVIAETVATIPAPINKGILMKNLMPKVKGKADGKLVATLVDDFLKIVNEH